MAATRIDQFDLAHGRIIGGKYVIESMLGAGWEGEVYKVVERRTGATRAMKVFYPQRNVRDRAVNFYARALERLKDCPIVIKYHHSETFRFRGEEITALISEFVEGVLLSELIRSQPGRRLAPYEAMWLLRTLAIGVAEIHARRSYHGDLHAGNILVQRRGVHFDIKLLDLYDQGGPAVANIKEDVIDLVRLFYDAVGGPQRYQRQPPEVKAICCGLRRGLILKKFPTARRLVQHLDTFAWE
ncbi:MAG: protein kinase [Phycisphaerales bacterium JB039]